VNEPPSTTGCFGLMEYTQNFSGPANGAPQGATKEAKANCLTASSVGQLGSGRRAQPKFMKDWKSFLKGDLLGVHLAVNIFVGATLLWLLLRLAANTNPIWAISAMVASIDPQVKLALANFRGRILNALLGCATGLLFLLVGGSSAWKLPLAMSATVLLSSYVIRVKEMWRQAPITAALIIAGGLTEHSKLSGVEIGLRRVGEVMLGCVIGLLVTWLISKIWPPQEPGNGQGATKPSSP
jgi:uncharacterized membrane protein YccC